jgi:hypothetical protein
MNIKATTRQAIAPEIQISMPYRRGDDNTVHMTLNTLGTSNRYAAKIIADLSTQTVTLTDYSQKTIDGSVSFLTPVELAPTVRAQLESSISKLIRWDDHPVVPAYSIERHRRPYTNSADLITSDGTYTVDFDCDGIHEVCTKTVLDDDGDVVYLDDKCQTPDWAHYSAAAQL